MCARRFLFVVTILTLLAVAAAFALFQWGGRVLIQQATPKGHFQAAAAKAEPDYSVSQAWIARPDMDVRGNPAEWRPAGFPPPIATPRRAAVFYVHPTTYLKGDRWNAPFTGDTQSDLRARLFVQSQASAFSNSAAVWAPRYRQAAYGAFLLKSEDARKALDLAWSDLSRAFDRFLREVPATSGIILAGHSQGALHLTRLLQERRDELKGRLVAAYVIGWPISTSADLPALGVPACRGAEQTGCILSWMSFGDPPQPDLILREWSRARGLAGGVRRQEDVLCVNPLTGTLNGSAPTEANLGTLVPTADLSSAELVRGRVGARCSKGLLIVGGDIPPLGPYVMPGNNYHVYDYALFWGSIARDAQRRLAAWRP